MKKIICTALAAICAVSTAAYAADYNQTLIGDNVVTYQGKAEKNSTVTFTVLQPGETLDEFMSVDNISVPVCYREVTADKDGNYTVEFAVGADGDTDLSNTYNIYVGGSGAKEIDKIALQYINEGENETARTALFADNADIPNVISTYGKAFGVRKSMWDLMSQQAYFDETTQIFKTANAANNLEKVQKALEKSIAITLHNNGLMGVFDGNTDAFDVPDSVGKWFEKSYMTDSAKLKIDSNVSKKITSVDGFDKEIAEKTALQVIESADGYGDVKTCLKENAALLDINENKVTDAFCKSVVGKTYSSIASTNIDSFKESSSSFGGSTGGGGGGGSKFPNTSVQNPKPEIPDPIETVVEAFDDLDGFDWAEEAINALYAEGVINGKSEGVFAPGDNVLREEFAKIVLEAVKFENLAGSVEFEDVSSGDWYYDFVTQAYLCGIIKGESETTFGSGKNITRQDMAVMCYNALVKKGVLNEEAESELSFKDSEEISDYAKEAVGALSNAKILNGSDDNTFNPFDFATRAEAAQMMYKAMNFIASK